MNTWSTFFPQCDRSREVIVTRALFERNIKQIPPVLFHVIVKTNRNMIQDEITATFLYSMSAAEVTFGLRRRLVSCLATCL